MTTPPKTFISLTLAFDVPFFFFLVGWSNSFKFGNIYRSYRGLFYIWLKWVFSFLLVFIFLVCIGKNDLSVNEFFNSFIFRPKTTFFPVFSASLWFMPVYFKVIFVNALVLLGVSLYAKKNNNNLIRLTNIYIYIILLMIVLLALKSNMFSVDRYLLFYSFFFMLGVIYGIRKPQNMPFSSFIMKVCTVIGLMFLFAWMKSVPVFPMQANKFPPSIIYLWYSLITILIAVYCRKFYRNKAGFINYIGKMAIWYYFSQGISSSILFYFVPLVNAGWILKFLIMLTLNLVMAITIAELFKRPYELIGRIIKKKISPVTE